MQSLEVSWAVRDIYIYIYDISRLRVKVGWRNNPILWCTVEKTSSYNKNTIDLYSGINEFKKGLPA